MPKLFGTDGIRGKFGYDLTEDLAEAVGASLVRLIKTLHTPKILIGMDTRESSPILCRAISRGIRAMGGDAVMLGVCSTPQVAYLLQKHSFDAGVMISASHNPYQYNGIKIFGSSGFKLKDDEEEKIESDLFLCEMMDEFGHELQYDDGTKEYCEYLKFCFGTRLDGLRIGIDCANGSAVATAKSIFPTLGAECYFLSDSPDGKNINLGCGSTDTSLLSEFVLKKRLDVGIAFDGDADRCIAVDECGREVDGDFIMAILSLRLKRLGMLRKNTLVATLMSNMGLGVFCKENGIDLVTVGVGDRQVLETMQNLGYSLGGEQSGHIIMRDVASTGDGQLTALALLSEIKESGKSLSALAACMKKYPQYNINIEADENAKAIFRSSKEIQQTIAEAQRMIFNLGRIVVRPSGTESLIRIMAEGDENVIKKLCDDLAKSISDILQNSKSSVRE